MAIPTDKVKTSTHGQILRSSAILGSTQGLVYIILIIRTKVAAVILGPTGIGTFGLYQSIVSFVGTLSNLGIPTSGVREIAEADKTGDPQRLSKATSVLTKVSWATGFFGWFVTAVFAYPLCLFTFQSADHVWVVALLGVTLVFSGVAGGYGAILQGRRRIGDLARLQLFGTILNVAITVILYALLGQNGIVPSIIIGGIIAYGTAWWFSRRATPKGSLIPWAEIIKESRQMISLGMAFMWNAVITGAVALATRALIVRDLGLEASGVYQAAWGISGMFAGFILTAMGTDFFPRLTAVADDPPEMNRMVNEQTEIGILLAMPGLLFTLALAPWLMHLFYSSKFLAGSPLLPWFVLGVFGQVISWPLGFIQMAKGASRSYMVTQTIYNIVHFSLILILFARFGLIGISFAFPVLYGIYTASMLVYSRSLTGFRWSASVVRLVIISTLTVGSAFIVNTLASGLWVTGVQLALAVFASSLTILGLAVRLPPEHRLHLAFKKLVSRFPS
jgi:enterobacterial common antigen flippase